MQTPVEMEFQEMAVSPAVQEMVADHVKKLEQRYGRITACRIAVKGPGNRHQTGGLYDVNIRLALPDGREVNVGRTPKADERHSDLAFAINDAFKRARRRLQDNARRMSGMIKSHEGQPIGTVARTRPRRRIWIPSIERWHGGLLPPKQPFGREIFRIGRWLPGRFCRCNWRKGSPGHHGETSRKARVEDLTTN